MESRDIYGITALFGTPDEIIRAASEVSSRGYTKFDVHSPYPLHGMDRAMRLKSSKLGLFALAFGFLGVIASVSLMTWVTLAAYPLVIGGKPFWSWPAFVPVAFEVTVLSASVLSVAAMIVIYFKFPNNSHPLHDTPYMKQVSSDKFGVCIEAGDPLFDEKKSAEMFKSLGGKEISIIGYDVPSRSSGIKLLDRRFAWILVLVALLSCGTTYFIFNHLMYMDPFAWMSHQDKLKAQEPSGVFADGIGMREPAAGTVARGYMPYAFAGAPDSAGSYLQNPVRTTKKILEEGRGSYLVYCSPCHGNFGRGDSRLRGQFPNPPTLHTEKARKWPDGQIYHIISEGQNVMPGYAAQIPRVKRWKIVHYVRALQRAQNAGEEDMK